MRKSVEQAILKAGYSITLEETYTCKYTKGRTRQANTACSDGTLMVEIGCENVQKTQVKSMMMVIAS